MPDVLPLIGQIDDIAVLFGGVMLFIQMCPPDVVDEHRAALAGEVKAPQTANGRSCRGNGGCGVSGD